MNQPTIHLDHIDDAGLVIPYPTGVLITNQTCGSACHHPTVEGLFAPLGPGANHLSDFLRTYFFDKYGTGGTSGIDDADARHIELQLCHEWDWLHVDRKRLATSEEAWVHMLAFHGLPMPFEDLGPFPLQCILTWENSD